MAGRATGTSSHLLPYNSTISELNTIRNKGGYVPAEIQRKMGKKKKKSELSSSKCHTHYNKLIVEMLPVLWFIVTPTNTPVDINNTYQSHTNHCHYHN